MKNYTKVGSDGSLLPKDAAEWVAVLDNDTGLMWPADHIITKELTFDAAQKAASKIKLAGFKDWRAPTIEELFTFPDRSRHGPAADPAFFRSTPSGWHWSSSVYGGGSGNAWLVNFSYGGADVGGRGSEAFVRPVRVARQS